MRVPVPQTGRAGQSHARHLPLHPGAASDAGGSRALAGALQQRLRSQIAGDVRFDATTRAAYTTDASNYRRVPVGVALPRSAQDVEIITRACREIGVPITLRGGGTSVAGNSSGEGLVIDTSRYLDRIVSIDPDRRTAQVEPGVVLDDLRRAAAAHGLTFGPDPSTHSRCTLGGMLGNNACGSHSVAWGRTADNVEALDVLTPDGTRLQLGAMDPATLQARGTLPGTEGRIFRAIDELLRRDGELIREHLRPWARRVSGYSLEHLLPEHGMHLARALVGTEGTCVTVLGATVRLVQPPRARALVVLGFADDEHAADAVATILPQGPLTVEGIDRRLVDLVRPSARPGDLPPGDAWLLVEVGGDSLEEAVASGEALAGVVESEGALVLGDPARQRVFWRLREEGAGTLTRTSSGAQAWPGWEDAAVPPEHLGVYLREFNALQREHGLEGITYGHFGEGCIHVRIDFDMVTADGRRGFRRFIEEAADLVVAHGGSLSGEHGDGMARSELLPRMYPPEILRTFEAFKAIWDPGDRMNPGIVVRPRPFDADLRMATAGTALDAELAFSYPADEGSFSRAVHRCIGVGACRSTEAGMMCPSFEVTRDETHSTRGRARLLQEMMSGRLVSDGWRSTEVRDALDLCLSCKACSSDCPVDVDMATYKAEFLHHHYARRVRPASHYSMGWLPLWLRLAQVAPRAGNAALANPAIGRLVARLGGVSSERRLPRVPLRSFTASFGAFGPPASPATRGPVVLWPDTFTNYLSPEVGRAAAKVLRSLGFEVVLPSAPVCCGLTWISTGQLGVARQVLARSVRALEDTTAPIVGLEPSCTATLREELPRLVDGAPAQAVADRVRTFAEFVDEHADDAQLPSLRGRVLSQPHCHQRATVGFGADERLLGRMGLDATTIDPACCGLAGNFGFEAGHEEVSTAVGERTVLPAVRAADPTTTILADGFSCRTQIEQGTGRTSLHLAQLMAAGATEDTTSDA